jgi:hypothetical protein
MATTKPSTGPANLQSSPSAAHSTSARSQIEAPSVSTPQARARFEFENGRGNDGTKVLMVEWEDDATTSVIAGKWSISWEGKPSHASQESTLLPAAETTTTSTTGAASAVSSAVSPTATLKKGGRSHEVETSAGKTHRIYFLLGIKRHIPAIVTLTLHPHDTTVEPIAWTTNPLPAIFPPGLADRETANRGKGILHNLWATRRLQRLEHEIEEEAKTNCEGIAFQLAWSEREWIEKEFKISLRESKGQSAQSESPKATRAQPIPRLQSPGGLNLRSPGDAPLSPSSPLSPGGSRLSEKLKGLKLQTTSDSSTVRPADDEFAVPPCPGKREKLMTDNTKSSSSPIQKKASPASKKDHGGAAPNMSSIGSVLAGNRVGGSSESSEGGSASGSKDDADEEAGLFALPLSPRSPDMKKSPFSWAADDTRKYLPAQ